MPKEMNDDARLAALRDERARLSALTFNDRIDEAMAGRLVNQVLQEVESVESSRSEFYEKRRMIIDFYEGRRESVKVHPFENAADVKTGLLFAKIDTQHAHLYPSVYNEGLVHWIAQDTGSVQNVDNNEKFMRWATRQIHFTDIVDNYVYGLLMEGTFVFKVRWDVDYRWVRRRVPKAAQIGRKIRRKLLQAVNRIIKVEIPDDDYETVYTYSKFERGALDCPPIDDVGFPNESVPDYDENKLSFIWHRTRPTAGAIAEKEELGLFLNAQRVLDYKENESSEKYKQAAKEPTLQLQRQQAEGTKPFPLPAEDMPCELIERYGKVSVPGVGRVECIVFVEKTSKTFLGCMPLTTVMRDGRRPWIISQFIRRKNRMLGKTPAEALVEIEKEVNSIHDQRLDAGTMSIIPPLFYRAAASMNPELLHIKPGLAIPLDDVNDAKWMQMPNNIIQSFQEEKMLLELADQISGIGPLQAGQESPVNRSRSTARGTLAIMSKGDVRLSTISVRLRQPLARALVMLRDIWAQNIPSGMEDRVVDTDGMPLFPQGLSAEDLAGNFDVVIEADPTAGDKEAELQNTISLFQMAMSSPLMMQNPGALWEVHAEVLRKMGRLEVEKYIGPKPQGQGIIFGKTVADEINMIRHGHLPVTRMGDNVAELYQGLYAFAQSDEAMAMEDEHKALLEVRLDILSVEMSNAMVQVNQEAIGLQGGAVGSTPAVAGPTGVPGMEAGMPAPAGAMPAAGGGVPSAPPGGGLP